MKHYTFSGNSEGSIKVGDRYLKKFDYSHEETMDFCDAAKKYAIRRKYFYDDGDDYIGQSDRATPAEPSSFVIEDHRLVGFYVVDDVKRITINCVLMTDGSVVGSAENSDSFPEASDTLVHMAFVSLEYSLVSV